MSLEECGILTSTRVGSRFTRSQPKSQSLTRNPVEDQGLQRTRWHYAVYSSLWLGVLFTHGLAAHYHLKMYRLYTNLDSSTLAGRLVAFDIVDASVGNHLPTHGAIHTIIFALHVLGAVMMLKSSLEDQTLTFHSGSRRWGFRDLARFVASLDVKESWLRVIELGLHTVIAYSITKSAPSDRDWCDAYVAVLVLCFIVTATTAIQHDPSTTSDSVTRASFAMLHLVGTVVVPCVFLLEYNDFTQFQDKMQWVRDVWVIEFRGNMQVILYTSWTDMLARVALAGVFVVDLQLLKVRLQSCKKTGRGTQSQAHTMQHWMARIRDEFQMKAVSSHRSRAAALAHWVSTLVLVGCGISIAVIHSQSGAVNASSVCNSSRLPWLTSESAASCALIDFNCAELRIDGRLTELESLWHKNLDPSTVQIVIIRHCAELQIPVSIRSFSDLKVLRIFNSTISSWPAESSIDDVSMSRLHTLNILNVNFTDGVLPQGLISGSLPSSLRAISIIQTNLQALPDDLDVLWNTLLPKVFLSIERSKLMIFPAVLMRLRVGWISLAHNAILEVPPELFQLDHLRVLNLAHTSLTALPVDVTRLGNALSVVSILQTSIADIPTWFDPFLDANRVSPTGIDGPAFRLKAGATKWCNSLVANLRNPRVAAYAAKTDCGAIDYLAFPLDFVAMRYDVSSVKLTAFSPPPA